MALTDKQRRVGALRPKPPAALLADDLLYTCLTPAPELLAWVQDSILAEDGPLKNPEHFHLIDADLEFLWASQAFSKQGRTVLGQCEEVMFRAGGWQKARQEQQFRDWFGRIPRFVVTLAADYCAQCSDAEFCSLVEHELDHIAHLTDEFGSPSFGKDGLPKLGLRGHDVEEFVGVVRRYGASKDVSALVDAAKLSPEVGVAAIAHSCGTCLKVSA
ncbi:putative metallopeptidase [Achromobacter sp. JUb104]|uniref:putative metallopeptidase n=1 Tax=Achromobacter sp. JUb104 TaxID=2940590 RepID=UPI002169F9F6|nr:putative metallopeptidase [Achromobacter sp. JUb104]MCS3504470.1 hypothetical protein [Achromobacter sp. JUb104]